MRIFKTVLLVCLICFPSVGFSQAEKSAQEKLWVQFEPTKAKSNGKHIVLIAGDDEYRSEEVMPMMGAILTKHHGFKCTVLFPVEPKTKTIKPSYQQNIPGMKFIANADLIIMGLRFRNLPDADMKYLDDFLKAGKPLIGIRTSTHAFRLPKSSAYHHYTFNYGKKWKGGFGQQVLGDTWISHHGRHGKQSTRGIIEKKNADHPILKGVKNVWGNTDVYGIRNLPAEATILLRGAVLTGMKPTDDVLPGKKNEPMMPVAWIKDYQMEGGKKGKAVCTTMGSSTDFSNEDLRRMMVNASFFLLGMKDKIDGKSNVKFVAKYQPTMFGFGNFVKNLKPSDFQYELTGSSSK